MPIVWRYLLTQYFKVFTFSVLAFVAILLTTRLDDIAHFATMGPEGKMIFLFILYQIPYILPIAIPISCLISALILVQRLCSTHELTALRAGGMSLGGVIAPLLMAGLVVGGTNFYIVSELTTQSHLASGLLKKDLRAINPLLLLHNKHLMRVKGFFFNAQGDSKVGEFASDIVLATPNRDNSRINLLLAKKLTANPERITGEGVTLVTILDRGENDDRLMIKNIGKATTTVEDFTQVVEKKVWTLNNDHLPLSLLLARIGEEEKRDSVYSEVARRLSVGMAAFCFTLMGIAYGLSIGRGHSSRGIAVVILLAAFYLICFFAAKGIDHRMMVSIFLYTLPLVVILAMSGRTISRINRGIE